jgi:hypothetical protein
VPALETGQATKEPTMAEQNLEDLSTKEIDALYKKTLAEAQKQRGFAQAQLQAREDLGLDHEFHKDQFGNIVQGPKPQPKQDRHYISPEGYVVDLKEGESAPVPQGKTLLEKVTRFVNENADNPDIKELLPADLSIFEEQSADFPDYYLLGTLRGKKWYVAALNDKDDARAFKFVLSNDLDREGAITAAHSYLETRVGPKFRTLTQTDVHKIQRLAASNRDAALSLYICACLPQQWEQEFVRLGAEAEITGSTMKLLEFTAKPEINPIVEEAVYAVWYWSKPGVELTPELDAFIQRRTEDRVLTFPILDSLLQKFQTGRAINHLGSQSAAEAGPSQEDLENLSEQEVEELYQKTRVERARSRR